MGRFFPHANVADVIANMRPRHAGTDGGYNATFTYPQGGAIAYVRALLRDLPPEAVACNERALAIEPGAVVTGRRRIACRHVVSSAPLPALARMCSADHDAAAFTSNKVLVFNLGFDRKGARGVHWMYFPRPRPRVLPGRLVRQHLRDRPDVAVRRDRRAIRRRLRRRHAARTRVLADLAAERIVDGHQLVAHHHVVLDPAYCHITKRSLAETVRLRAALKARGVHSIGRYGGWTYCSIEDNIVEARALAARL